MGREIESNQHVLQVTVGVALNLLTCHVLKVGCTNRQTLRQNHETRLNTRYLWNTVPSTEQGVQVHRHAPTISLSLNTVERKTGE